MVSSNNLQDQVLEAAVRYVKARKALDRVHGHIYKPEEHRAEFDLVIEAENTLIKWVERYTESKEARRTLVKF